MQSKITYQLDSKSKPRETQDGRKCAEVFVYDGKTYHDCTSSRAPNGILLDKEWCYVNTDQNDVAYKNWDYCIPTLNYDKVREVNQKSMREITIEFQIVNNDISKNIGPAQNALDELKMIKDGQAELDNKINLLLKNIQNINSNLINLENTKKQWENMEKLVQDLEVKIDQKKENAKEQSNEENKEIIDQDTDKGKVIDFIQKRKTNTEKDCNGMLTYEDEEKGDGLIGKYFDNESWLGSYIERKDSEINFDWTGSSPMKGINLNNFSIRWEGFIYIPSSSLYSFAIECDDGVSLEINGQTIIYHNMNSAIDNKSIYSKESETDIIKTNNKFKSISKEIKLNGGTKFK